jgi:Arc/MetJ-type ribon-helix-helix transcriptional regulator
MATARTAASRGAATRTATAKRNEKVAGIAVGSPAAVVDSLPAPRARVVDSEKLTINLGAVDLGSIDLLVAEGFFSNRSDLIRTAVRNLLAGHRDIVNGALARQERTLGLRRITRAELEGLRSAGQRIRVSVVGLVIIDDDVSTELARETIAALSVLGTLQANPALKAALAGRLV